MDEFRDLPLEDFIRELFSLSKLHHPGIMRLFGFCIEADERMFVVSEFCPHSLADMVLNRSSSAGGHEAGVESAWTNTLRTRAAAQIAGAMAFVHEREILHRDIKVRGLPSCQHGHDIHTCARTHACTHA